MCQIHRQWWHFLRLVGYCWFWWYFITKVWSVHNTIIIQPLSCSSVFFPYRGSSEMSQIHRQWWHFLRLVGFWWFWWNFNTKVWSVHNTTIVISWVPYWGSSEMSQIHVQWWHFLTVISSERVLWHETQFLIGQPSGGSQILQGGSPKVFFSQTYLLVYCSLSRVLRF